MPLKNIFVDMVDFKFGGSKSGKSHMIFFIGFCDNPSEFPVPKRHCLYWGYRFASLWRRGGIVRAVEAVK